MSRLAIFIFGMLIVCRQAPAYEPQFRYQAPFKLPSPSAPHAERVAAYRLAKVAWIDDGRVYFGNKRSYGPKEALRIFSQMGALEAASLARRDMKSAPRHHHSGGLFDKDSSCSDPNCGNGLGGCGNANLSGGEAAGAVLIAALVAVIAVVVIVAVVKAIREKSDANLPEASNEAAVAYNRHLLKCLDLSELSPNLN